MEELCRPYAAVIDIDRGLLPEPKTVRAWSGSEFAAVLRHDQKNPAYNRHFRQLIHVGFKVAAEMGPAYLQALDANADVIVKRVTSLGTGALLPRHGAPSAPKPTDSSAPFR